MKNKLFAFIILIHISSFSLAQNPVMENNPVSVKWERIITPYFNIIFPKGSEDLAQRTANLLETVYEPGAISMDKYPKKTSVILQNKNAISNGFVSWTPYRSEFNTFPSQAWYLNGNNDWMELLSFHEYRHMVQIQKSKVGFNKIVNILFGQASTAAMANFAAPDWFWEGDATVMETALTQSGRGRIPHFDLIFRSNLMEKGSFTYNKQYLRSFKDAVPDQYVTGYHFTGYLREKYGVDVMEKVTEHAWKWSFVPFMFSNSLKKYTGKYLLDNYRDFVDHQKSEWENQIEKLGVIDYEPINKRQDHIFTNYTYPHLMEDGKILALKSGLGDIHTFVFIDQKGKEKELFIPGFMQPTGRFSFNGQKIVWDEVTPDLRWGARNYSDVKLYDLENGKIERITLNERYSSSAISPDGKKIVTTKNDTKYQNSLVVLDLYGNILHEYIDPQNAIYLCPDWTEDSQKIIAVKLLNRNKSIVLIDPKKGAEEVVFEGFEENMHYPKKCGDYIFYQSPYNGIGNIYVMDINTKIHYQVTNARYGAYHPFLDTKTNTLYFNNHQEFGYDIASIPFDIESLTEKSKVKVFKDPLPEVLANQESGTIEPEDIADYQFPIEKYSSLKGIINPHSWGVTVGSLDNEYVFFVNSRDIRSTTSINGGYAYNFNENAGKWEVTASYQGLYPITDFSFYSGDRRMTNVFNDTARTVSWDETGIELGLRVPINLTRNRYYQNVLLGAKAGFTEVSNYYYPYEPRFITINGNLQSLKLNANFRRLLKVSKRDIYSRWGQVFNMYFFSTPFKGDYESTLFALDASAFFPGIFKHHSFFVRGGYKYENDWNYTFSSPIRFPRGYNYSSFDNFYMASFNYSLPLLYPDLGVGPLLYIQRIRANLFYDYGKGETESNFNFFAKDKTYNSTGIEVNFEFNVMRYLALLDVGFRVNYLPDEQDVSYDIIIGSLGF